MRNLFVCCAIALCTGCTGTTTEPLPPETTSTATASSLSAEPSASSAQSSQSGAAQSSAAQSSAAQSSTSTDSASFAAHTPATLVGTLSGKPFEAGGACVVGPSSFAPGYVYIEIYDKTEADTKGRCGALSKEKGARKVGIVMPWKQGDKVDLATLKAKKNDVPLFVMERINDNKADRKDAGKDFKPTGVAEVVRSAPKDGVGRIKVSLTAGKDKLEGEVDVDVVGEPSGS